MSVPFVRAVVAQDGISAREIVRSAYEGTRHLGRTLELVELALTGEDPECLGLACIAGNGMLEGLILYGNVGGAMGVVKLQAFAGYSASGLTALLGGARAADSVRGVRMFLCELSDAPEHASASTMLESHGFRVETRVADYFAEGSTMQILVLRVAGAQE